MISERFVFEFLLHCFNEEKSSKIGKKLKQKPQKYSHAHRALTITKNKTHCDCSNFEHLVFCFDFFFHSLHHQNGMRVSAHFHQIIAKIGHSTLFVCSKFPVRIIHIRCHFGKFAFAGFLFLFVSKFNGSVINPAQRLNIIIHTIRMWSWCSFTANVILIYTDELTKKK